MKIYTKTGDDGTTSLFAGGRVSKHHLRVEAYGTVDELNSFVGLIRATSEHKNIDEWLEVIQNELFNIGADLATPMDAENVDWLKRLEASPAEQIEIWIDTLDKDLDPLKNFVLPGGTIAACHTHVARTVCRRAERLCVALSESDAINNNVLVYLNRLSDFFFALARWLNKKADIPESKWAVRS